MLNNNSALRSAMYALRQSYQIVDKATKARERRERKERERLYGKQGT